MLSNIKDEGIILNTRDFRENDKILDIFLANHGIISVIAFGAKKSKKRFGGNLDPFNIASFEIQGRKNRVFLKEVTIKKFFWEIKRNIQTIDILFNLSMLLIRQQSIEKDIYKALFKLLVKLEENRSQNFIKYYVFFLLYFLKKEGLIAPPKCFYCDNTEIKYYVKSELIYFQCHRCKEDNSLLLTPDEVQFIKICLEGNKDFENKNFASIVYDQLQDKLLAYLNTHFRINLKKI
jgi:DNA repair protein RecO (recombination protein O)